MKVQTQHPVHNKGHTSWFANKTIDPATAMRAAPAATEQATRFKTATEIANAAGQGLYFIT